MDFDRLEAEKVDETKPPLSATFSLLPDELPPNFSSLDKAQQQGQITGAAIRLHMRLSRFTLATGFSFYVSPEENKGSAIMSLVSYFLHHVESGQDITQLNFRVDAVIEDSVLQVTVVGPDLAVGDVLEIVKKDPQLGYVFKISEEFALENARGRYVKIDGELRKADDAAHDARTPAQVKIMYTTDLIPSEEVAEMQRVAGNYPKVSKELGPQWPTKSVPYSEQQRRMRAEMKKWRKRHPKKRI